MSRWPRLALLVLAAAGTQLQAAPDPLYPLTAEQAAPLELFDTIATQPQLELALGPDVPAALASMLSPESALDPGLRIRALRALSLYPGNVAQIALTDEIRRREESLTGMDVIYLRAAVEALGIIGKPQDVATLVPLLEFEASRDVRAAVALALKDVGSSQAIAPLRDRYAREQVPQVRLAISEALRELGQQL
jgi:HEAT repeat protein